MCVSAGTSPPIIATLVDKLLQRSLQDAILDIVKSFSIRWDACRIHCHHRNLHVNPRFDQEFEVRRGSPWLAEVSVL